MPRLKSIPVAIGAVVLSAGTVFGFAALPEAAGPGLTKASDAAGRTVPARPAAPPAAAPEVVAPAVAPAVGAEDLPDAAAHGQAVSTVATSEDATPDTNKGADVSAVAKDNHGQATAAEHQPADAGAPEGVGKPEGAGKPTDPGQPADPGAPDGAGKPE